VNSKPNRRGSKPAGGGTPAPASPRPSPLAELSPVIRSLHERRRVLRECAANQDVWTLIYAAIEFRELIVAIGNRVEASEKSNGDPAVVALDDAEIKRPHKSQWFGKGTFAGVIERFDSIAEKINEEIGCICGELPPPPASFDRRAA
jgi:hypothetical protein